MKELHHGNAYYQLGIKGLWHQCYKMIKVCKNSSGRHASHEEVFSGMLSECCTLKRACKRAARLPVRLSVPVSVQGLSYDVLHA